MKQPFISTRHFLFIAVCLQMMICPLLAVSPVPENQANMDLYELPSPLFAFGQFIVPKGWRYLTGVFYGLEGRHMPRTEFWPRFTYGLRDDLTLTVYPEIALILQNSTGKSKGLEDTVLRLEYQVFKKDVHEAKLRMTVLGALFLPTGSVRKNPPTSFGGTSYFMGSTLAYLEHRWYFFCSEFIQLTTKRHHTRLGRRFFYEWGGGFNLYVIPKTITTVLLEFSGELIAKDIIKGKTDCNSGGNTIFCGPSVLVGNDSWWVQGGCVFPIAQRLNGTQPRAAHYWGVYVGVRV